MKPETWQAPPGDRIPNNPRFPVLVYRGVRARHRLDAAVDEHGKARVVGDAVAGWRLPGLEFHRYTAAKSAA